MTKRRIFKNILSSFSALLIAIAFVSGAGAVGLTQDFPPENGNSQVEVVSPYYSYENITTPDGVQLTRHIINGPSEPLPEFEAERQASITTVEPQGTLANFPSYDWVFGCSAVSGAMIAAWYDRGFFPNLYTGPTNSGIMPLTDTGWSTWSDGFATYPNNPLIASHNGLDGRGTKGSIDDYWVEYDSSVQDPYLSGGWTEHAWGTAIGDYMKTSQSAYGNSDGATSFWTWTSSPTKFTCDDMVNNGYSTLDGTYGRKLFYEARGYTVTDCYNQKTDNSAGGFTLANFQAEIDSGNPVLLNLDGHSIVGYGYNGSTIYIRDTWDSDPSHTYTMTWGGSYQGMNLLSVSVVHLTAPVLNNTLYLPLIQSPAPAPVVNPFLNPGFEQGSLSWTQSSTGGWDLILQSTEAPVTALGGSWLAWLGGAYNETAVLSQTITISASAPYLHFWFWSASEDYCGFDYFYVGVNGNYFSSSTLCSTNNTGGWVEKVVNLSAYVGSNKTVQLKVVTDSSLNSNVFLDDFSMSNSATTSGVQPVSTELYPGAALLGK